jgi:hypothetical protein
MWEVGIDPGTGNAEITPIRHAEFTCNVTMFLQPPAGKISNLGIEITDLSQFNDFGLLDVKVTLTHPFPGLDMYTGFDVLGVFINNSDTVSSFDPTVLYARTEGVARLLNADGYTRWYNPVEFLGTGLLGYIDGALGDKNAGFDATINPYKYFTDNLGPEDDLTDFLHLDGVIESRCPFSSGSANSRLYKLQFPMDSGSPYLTFQYAVVASWEPPLVNPPQNIPDDFPIGANLREPFQLSIVDNGSTLFYSGGVGGGTLKMKAELFDWSAATNPSGILGEFSSIVIESPNADIPGGYAAFTPEDFLSYISPSTTISSVADLEFEGVEPSGPEDVEFLVTVVSKSGETYDQGFGVPVPDAPLASYFRFSIPVGENPCANFNVTGAIPTSAESGQSYPGFIVEGDNFQDGANLAVDIMDGADVVASGQSVVYVDSHTLTCDLDLCGSKPGDLELRVTNGCDPVSYDSIPYHMDPDPLKNIVLRSGAPIWDIGVCKASGEPYVQFADGQLWIYTPDYSSGQYMITNTNLNRIAVCDPDTTQGQTGGEATMGSTTDPLTGQWIYQRDLGSMWNTGYAGTMLDVMSIYDDTRHYYIQDQGAYLLCARRTVVAHGGNVMWYPYVGSGPGYVNAAAVKGLDWVGDLPENYTAWFYFLQGAPEYSVERCNYDSVLPGAHNLSPDSTFFGTKGDGHDQVNDPRDIACDLDFHVFILDKYSNEEPVVKIYDSDLGYLGEVGDSITISGDPLRLDIDDGDGEVHVVHSNGVSVFRPCELPF